MVPTTDSMVAAAWTVQPVPEAAGAAPVGGREVTWAMAGRLPSPACAPPSRRAGRRGGGGAGCAHRGGVPLHRVHALPGRRALRVGGRRGHGGSGRTVVRTARAARRRPR